MHSQMKIKSSHSKGHIVNAKTFQAFTDVLN